VYDGGGRIVAAAQGRTHLVQVNAVCRLPTRIGSFLALVRRSLDRERRRVEKLRSHWLWIDIKTMIGVDWAGIGIVNIFDGGEVVGRVAWHRLKGIDDLAGREYGLLGRIDLMEGYIHRVLGGGHVKLSGKDLLLSVGTC
jgi:hypothetical protein